MTESAYKKDLMVRLKDPAYACAYLNAALVEAMEDQFVGGIMVAVRDIIDARGGVTNFSKAFKGKSRTSLYKTLNGKGNPEFATVLLILKVLKINLRFNNNETLS